MTDAVPPFWKEVIWSPWRIEYIRKERPPGCVFCEVAQADAAADGKRYVLHRGAHHFVVLNLWPYNNGHVMVIPYRHVDDILDLTDDEAMEMHRLSCRIVKAYRKVMRAQGVNVGLNLGQASGGSIEHLHLHLVPRWIGDSNFMPVIGQTKVLVEMLDSTYRNLRGEAESWDEEARP